MFKEVKERMYWNTMYICARRWRRGREKGKNGEGRTVSVKVKVGDFSHSLFELKTLLFGHLLQMLYHSHTVYVLCNYTDFEPLWRIDYNNNIYALISSKTLLQPYNHTFSNSWEQNEASFNVCLDITGNSICTLQFNSITISRPKATTERGT